MKKLTDREILIKKFEALNVGQLEEIYEIPLDVLERLINELTQAQELGDLNLETFDGIDNLRAIVSVHLQRSDFIIYGL